MGRLKRQKQTRKILDFYRMQFQIQRPFKVLLDGNFIHHCVKNNINIRDRLSTLLSDPKVEPLVPNQVIDELTSIGAPCAEALAMASTFKQAPVHGGSSSGRKRKRRGGDDGMQGEPSKDVDDEADNKIAPSTAILHLLGRNNRHRYMVATQDVDLRKMTHGIPGVPAMYLNIGVSVLEPPSRSSRERQAVTEQKKLAPRKDERRRIQNNKSREAAAAARAAAPQVGRDAELNLPRAEAVRASPIRPKKKRYAVKGPKQPNPMSMKKKKIHNNKKKGDAEGPKRKRRKKKQAEKKKMLKNGGGGE